MRAGVRRAAARAVLGFAACTAPAGAAAAQQATVVVLVRHAERAAAPANDPPLSPEGEARALALAAALAESGVSAIVTTQFERTRGTARPLAQQLNLAPEVVGAGGPAARHAEAVAEFVRGRRGGTILVVGHSNTVPAIIAALGGPRLPDLCEGEYANLFVLVLRDGSPASLVRGRIGNTDPEGAASCRQR
jgi:broad specificity phosphatase PhoE